MKDYSFKMSSPAKINYVLEIKNRREDGYHNIETVYQSISFYDELLFAETSMDIQVETDSPELSDPAKNLVFRAAQLLRQKKQVQKGARIFLKKNIPIGSGLGGGSSNAASTLRGLNLLWRLKMTDPEIYELASQLGSDVPFFVRGGMAIGRGKGEKISPIMAGMKPRLPLILVCPPFKVSSEKAYKMWDEEGHLSRDEGLDDFLRALYRKDLRGLTQNLHNDFEPMIIKECHLVKTIKDVLLENGAKGALMTGSGSAVYGIFRDENRVDELVEKLSYLGKVVKAFTI